MEGPLLNLISFVLLLRALYYLGVTHYSYGEGFGDVAWGEGGPSCIDLESFMVLLSLCLLVPLVDGSTAQKEVILFNLI